MHASRGGSALPDSHRFLTRRTAGFAFGGLFALLALGLTGAAYVVAHAVTDRGLVDVGAASGTLALSVIAAALVSLLTRLRWFFLGFAIVGPLAVWLLILAMGNPHLLPG